MANKEAVLADPKFIEAARSLNQDVETHWRSLAPGAQMMHVKRVAETPVAPKPVLNSYEDMDYNDFANMAQNQSMGVSPVSSEMAGLGADYSGIKKFDDELKRKALESTLAVDEGLLAERAQGGDGGAEAALSLIEKGRLVEPSQIGNNPPIEGILSGTAGYQPPMRDPNDPRGPSQIPPPILSDRVNDPRGVHQIPKPVGVSGGPILSDRVNDPRGVHQIPMNPTAPILADPTKPAPSNGVLNSTSVGSGPTRNNGNARGSRMPFNKIGAGEDRTAYANVPTSEMLMRVGGRIAAGSRDGYNAAMDAGAQEYGIIKDANRRNDTEAYLEQVRQQEVADKAAADAASGSGTAMAPPNATYQKAALRALDQIQTYIDADGKYNPFDDVSGIMSAPLRNVYGTNAYNVMQAVKTVEASVGFDRLQLMREQSPTGGALGQVSNIELELLKTSLGNLNQAQTKKQFQDNINEVRKHYKATVELIDAQKRAYFLMQRGMSQKEALAEVKVGLSSENKARLDAASGGDGGGGSATSEDNGVYIVKEKPKE